MHQTGALIVALATAARVLAGQSADRELRLEPFTSATFGNTRTLRILVPPDNLAFLYAQQVDSGQPRR
jgi:hypothetical protein